MAKFPHDHELKVVDKTNKDLFEALGLSKGDVLDMSQAISKYLLKISEIKTNAETIVYFQSMPKYLLAIVAHKLFKDAYEKHVSASINNPFEELLAMLKKAAKESAKTSSGKPSDDDDDCSDCEFKDLCGGRDA